MQRFSRVRPLTPKPRFVRDLLERPAAVREHDWVESALHLFSGDSVIQWIPVLDDANQPVAVAGRPLVPGTEPRLGGIYRIPAELSVSDAARRGVRRPAAERLTPFVRCDSRGRYVGLVRMERIIEELSLVYDRQQQTARDDPRKTPLF